VPEALASAEPVQRYAPMSQATQDFSSCAERMLGRIAAAGQAPPSPRSLESTR
jgi:hypothetical protein